MLHNKAIIVFGDITSLPPPPLWKVADDELLCKHRLKSQNLHKVTDEY